MKNIIETHVIPEGIDKIRLDVYAATVFPHLPTKKSAYKAIKRGDVLLDGKMCEPCRRISPGHRIEITERKNNTAGAFKLNLNIVYEDEHLAVIEKPPGFSVSGNRFKTIENALPYNLKPSNQPDSLRKPKPVHRLDSSTGGLLLIAKTQTALIGLSRQFQARGIKKRYRAVLIGRIEGSGCINEPVGGRDAETKYGAISHTPSIKNKWLTLADLVPDTGRTHQLRRHMQHMGFPILGDKIYGTEGLILKSKGLFLWAVEISFTHPIDESHLTFTIEEPEKFKTFLEREKRRREKYGQPY